jgi:hypothetical protein
MKRIFLGLLLTALVVSLPAQILQKPDKLSVPFFDIVQADGNHYRATDLVPGEPVMLVYFDPDCDHCEVFIKSLLKQTGEFKNIQVVLITYVPLKVVKNYVLKTGLDKFPQFKTGTEGEKFIVRYHYNILQFPYVALHDKNGKLFATFESDMPPVSDLAKMFQ